MPGPRSRREEVEEKVQDGRDLRIGGCDLPGLCRSVRGLPEEAVQEKLWLHLGRAPGAQDQSEKRDMQPYIQHLRRAPIEEAVQER